MYVVEGEERRRRLYWGLADVAVRCQADGTRLGKAAFKLPLFRSHMPPRYDKEIGQKAEKIILDSHSAADFAELSGERAAP